MFFSEKALQAFSKTMQNHIHQSYNRMTPRKCSGAELSYPGSQLVSHIVGIMKCKIQQWDPEMFNIKQEFHLKNSNPLYKFQKLISSVPKYINGVEEVTDKHDLAPDFFKCVAGINTQIFQLQNLIHCFFSVFF